MSRWDPSDEQEEPSTLGMEITAALAWLWHMSPVIVATELVVGAAVAALNALMRPGQPLAGLSATISPDILTRWAGSLALGVMAVMLVAVVWGGVVSSRASSRLLLGERRVQQAQHASGEQRTFLLHDATRLYRAAALGMLRLGGRAGYAGYAAVLNSLGIALKHLAEDASGEEQLRLLHEAVDAFRRAAEGFALKRRGEREWAEARTNLGGALIALAARSSGGERVRLLREAVSVGQAALAAESSHGSPGSWATTANNLAVALGSLADLTDGDERARLLSETLRVQREIANMRVAQRGRLSWSVLNNLGVSLISQSKQSNGEARRRLLAEAIEWLRAALAASTTTRSPRDWATTQSNLAAALCVLAEETTGRERLDLAGEAMAACRAALSVRTRTDMPTRWAKTMNNLSDALRVAAEAYEGEERARLLGESATVCVEALRLPLRTMDPYIWAMMHSNLGRALARQAEMASWVERRQLALSAIAAFHSALEVFTEQHMPVDHRRTLGYLKHAEAVLA